MPTVADGPQRPAFDARVYNVAAAVWYGAQHRWVAPFHGSGSDDQLALCDCDRCVVALAQRKARLQRELEMLRVLPTSGPAPPHQAPRRTEVGPVRERLRVLLDAGMTHTDIALVAGVDRSTLYRIVRPDVRGVHVDTAAALAAVDVEAWRERAASTRTMAAERDEAIVREQRHRADVYAAGGHFVNGRATDAPRRKRAPGEEPPHGTSTRYAWRFDPCRCDDCRVAMNADRAARKRAQRRRRAESTAPF